MSGHSKWSQIKRTKGALDAKRGVLFSKLGKRISIAVREGGGIGDPAHNMKLRAAIEKAKAASMPNDNIDRAIKKGLGEGVAAIEEVLYEAYGPYGTALMIEGATDNKNRTVSNIKHLLNKAGGNLGGPGSVAWQFLKLGQIVVEAQELEQEQLEMVAIDNGAEDIEASTDGLIIYTKPEKMESITDAISSAGGKVLESEVVQKSNQTVELDAEQKEKINRLLEEIDNDDDVIAVHSNADLS